ncbi:eukaryotic translation initiation factor 3 [Heterostelium album PN500]|uniref:Eukaryotic translation initiation factor 3 subunit K n=1 Tax=Heterostelium pallidum (strain ATCC 26659 / Pp 5 / PN500) TaxID=670386 RepID=D3B6R0_HETP5|nr:eukaryotic translation initiation factor 3 [Heterostelium album PN500]EFA83030.1 eukaryotic translation initiation factor 3 [Heterostelium album PN500]|eukprot:XP_020435147.1 eukaryotic translation initiation factor 3 [Heterostelium album PN500]
MSDTEQEQIQQDDHNQLLDVDLSTLSTPEKMELITNIIADSYNINIAQKLEQFLDIQINENIYHFQANSTLLKLYQFNPSALNKDYIAKMLAKALMNLPSNDFLFLSYMIPFSMQKEEPLLKLFVLNNLLETCKFKEAWEHIQNNQAFFSVIPSFVDSVRNFVSNVLSITYQTITITMLVELLNIQQGGLDEFMSTKPSWKSNGTTVSLQSDSVKQKKSDIFTFDRMYILSFKSHTVYSYINTITYHYCYSF